MVELPHRLFVTDPPRYKAEIFPVWSSFYRINTSLFYLITNRADFGIVAIIVLCLMLPVIKSR
jgi:hypothetical protein